MDRLVIHVVIKQDCQAGCIVTTKPKIEFKLAWYEMRMQTFHNSNDKQPQILCIAIE